MLSDRRSNNVLAVSRFLDIGPRIIHHDTTYMITYSRLAFLYVLGIQVAESNANRRIYFPSLRWTLAIAYKPCGVAYISSMMEDFRTKNSIIHCEPHTTFLKKRQKSPIAALLEDLVAFGKPKSKGRKREKAAQDC